jgi:hydroxyacylglutathione hydrolase
MEKLNLRGADPARLAAPPAPLTNEFVAGRGTDVTLVDVRSAAAFLGAHLPNSIALPIELIASFAGWILEPDQNLILIAEQTHDAETAVRRLSRIGFDRVLGYLEPNLASWAASGNVFNTVDVISADDVRRRIEDPPANWTLLDVRSEEEVESIRIPDSSHIYIGELPGRLHELDARREYTLMCGSGSRATVAVSILLRAGFDNVDLFFGSLGAWKASGFVTEQVA